MEQDGLKMGQPFKHHCIAHAGKLLRFTSSVARTEVRRIQYNTTSTTNGWIGGVGEIIGLSATSPTSDRQKIEAYLAHKWGLNGKLPSNHPYKLGHPLSTGSPSFITDTPFGDGKAIDLADGHVEISTGGNEDVFDGNGSFSVSAWVKGWPDEYPENIASKGYAIPTSKELKHPELWLDAGDQPTLERNAKQPQDCDYKFNQSSF